MDYDLSSSEQRRGVNLFSEKQRENREERGQENN
jgi:hypothetical protein